MAKIFRVVNRSGDNFGGVADDNANNVSYDEFKQVLLRMAMRTFDTKFKTSKDLMMWYKQKDLKIGHELIEPLTNADKLQWMLDYMDIGAGPTRFCQYKGRTLFTMFPTGRAPRALSEQQASIMVQKTFRGFFSRSGKAARKEAAITREELMDREQMQWQQHHQLGPTEALHWDKQEDIEGGHVVGDRDRSRTELKAKPGRERQNEAAGDIQRVMRGRRARKRVQLILGIEAAHEQLALSLNTGTEHGLHGASLVRSREELLEQLTVMEAHLKEIDMTDGRDHPGDTRTRWNAKEKAYWPQGGLSIDRDDHKSTRDTYEGGSHDVAPRPRPAGSAGRSRMPRQGSGGLETVKEEGESEREDSPGDKPVRSKNRRRSSDAKAYATLPDVDEDATPTSDGTSGAHRNRSDAQWSADDRTEYVPSVSVGRRGKR